MESAGKLGRLLVILPKCQSDRFGQLNTESTKVRERGKKSLNVNSAIYHRWPLSITFPIRSALKFKSKEDFSESGPRGSFPGRVAGDLPSCHFFPTWGEAPRPRSAGRGGCGQPWPARPAPGW